MSALVEIRLRKLPPLIDYARVLQRLFSGIRFLSTNSHPRFDLRKLRPMILKRIEEREKDYPIKGMLPVANEVLAARKTLYGGVSTLIAHIPTWACKHCPEVYVGDGGHLIRSCSGYRRHYKNKLHTWMQADINNVLIPVEAFHLQKMFQKVIEHKERFNYDRTPAVVELCLQAGADSSDPLQVENSSDQPSELTEDELRTVAKETLQAWETLRSGVRKLLLVHAAKVCKYCSEVHVGPSGHEARTCGVFKHEKWRGKHFWENAKVDDLVPPNMVWSRRRQDPAILVEEGRNYYGHAPVVVDLCSKADAVVPSKYSCMMKLDGISKP